MTDYTATFSDVRVSYCSLGIESPILLPTPYSMYNPPAADPTAFMRKENAIFLGSISLTDCSAVNTQAIASIPTYLDLAANASSVTVQRDPALASHTSAKAVAGIIVGGIIVGGIIVGGIIVGIIIAVFLIFLASLLKIRKHRKIKMSLAAISNEHNTMPDLRHHLDQKAMIEGR